MGEQCYEPPRHHWKYVNVRGRRVLDLGCGRWEQNLDPVCRTTPEWFLQQGASFVVGVDTRGDEIAWFRQQYGQNPLMHFEERCINSVDAVKELFNRHRPDCVKMDIEAAEIHWINAPDECIKRVAEYYLECHGKELYEKCLARLAQCGFTVYKETFIGEEMGYCRVVYARRNE